jgi:hypothetical protein
MPWRGGLVTALLVQVAAAQACLEAAPQPGWPEAQRLAAGPVQLAWRAEALPLRVSQPFAIELALCPAVARLVRVDATMPEHRHGMNYRTRIEVLGAGQHRVQGLVWHMPGRWELRFDVEVDGAVHTLRQSVELK